MKITDEIIEYILELLIGNENESFFKHIIYDIPDEYEDRQGKIFIVPSTFFESSIYMTKDSIPKQLAGYLEGLPIFFGIS